MYINNLNENPRQPINDLLRYKTEFVFSKQNINCFYKHFFLKNTKLIVVEDFLKKILDPITESYIIKSFLKINNALFFYMLYIKNNYNTYKYFFGYPKRLKGSHANGNSSKTKKEYFRNFLVNKLYRKYFEKLHKTKKFQFCLFEFFNKIWFFFWRESFDMGREKLLETEKKIYEKPKYAKDFTLFNRAITFKKIIKKKNKKKQLTVSNMYNIGFKYKFTLRNDFRMKF